MRTRPALPCALVLALLGGLLVAVATEAQEIFVANLNAHSVTVHALTASGNTAPVRTLQGLATGLSNSFGIALDLSTGAATIPTLSQWAQLGMVLILVGIAVTCLRRRAAETI